MTEQLEHIESKVRQLVEELEILRHGHAILEEENNKLRAELESHEERAGELTQRLTNTQRALAQQRGDETENSQKLRKQIDQYIREIDKCIAWLQNA